MALLGLISVKDDSVAASSRCSRLEIKFPFAVSLSSLGCEHFVDAFDSPVHFVERITIDFHSQLAHFRAEHERALAPIVAADLQSVLNDAIIDVLSNSQVA